MTRAIFRGSFTCRACGRRTETLAHGRVKSIDDLLPTGGELVGDSFTCFECLRSSFPKRGRALPADESRPSSSALPLVSA